MTRTAEKAINHAYHYAYYRLKLRKVTPISEAFFVKYQETAQTYRKNPSLVNRTKLATLTDVLNSKVILHKFPSVTEKDSFDALKELVIMRYLADYGDYLSEECWNLRETCVAKLDSRDSILSKNWTVVQKAIDQENQQPDDWRAHKIGSRPKTNTLSAIHMACSLGYMDKENTLFSIKWYSERNGTMHSNVDQFIKECVWKSLGTRLWLDLSDVPKIFWSKDQESMKNVLLLIQNRYFVYNWLFEIIRNSKSLENGHAVALTLARLGKEWAKSSLPIRKSSS